MAPEPSIAADTVPRRRLFGWLATAGAAVGLSAAYGAMAAMFGRFLLPARSPASRWMYVSRLTSFKFGDALRFRIPSGATVNIARQGAGDRAEDFVALSSTCPHLGCQVHWEQNNDRFFCPCHNGVFSPDGKGIGGPPGDAGQSLPRYALKVEKGLIFIEVDADQIAQGAAVRLESKLVATGPGHDPCLDPSIRRCQSPSALASRDETKGA